MYAYDFEYDGKLLSEFGFIIGSFNGANGLDTAGIGSEITFLTTPIGDGRRHSVNGTFYEKCLSATFQICKDPSSFSNEEMEITADEFRQLSRWLNRREYLWFHAFDRDAPEHERPWFRASFVLTRLDLGNATYGIELTMATDSPFGYGTEIVQTLSFAQANTTLTVRDMNDEIGECLPDVSITCLASGTLELTNSLTGCQSVFENCAVNEVITLSGDTMIVSTSASGHNIANDFNYDWFCIGNTYTERQNSVTASKPCTVTLRYRPVIKDTI